MTRTLPLSIACAVLALASASAQTAAAAKPAAGAKAATGPTASTDPVDVGSGYSTDQRSKDVLAHLNEVIRYYRMSVSPIQKVGEPSDALYRDEAATQAGGVADYAFQSAKAEAVLVDAYAQHHAVADTPAASKGESSGQSEAERLQGVKSDVATRLTALKQQQAAVEDQLTHPKPGEMAGLIQQKKDIQGAIDLSMAMSDALGKIVSMADTQGKAGLAGDIARLQQSAPEIQAGKGKPIISSLESLDSARSSGVSSQAVTLFQLLTTRRAIEQWLEEEQELHTQATALRAPLTTILRNTMQQGTQLSQQVSASQTPAETGAQTGAQTGTPGAAPAAASPVPGTPVDTTRMLAAITATFKALSGAAVPLSQEIILLEQSRANLIAWRAAVNEEYHEVLRSLLARVITIAITLGIVLGLGEVWKRATVKYVRDPRRRRQIMAMRRMVVGFLSGLVVLLGFVSQFNSLTTFAGFITAGLAVGLQTILLSVAAYFFIVGRYGVRVGDRISVAGVSGDVIDVGLVRFYMMELAGTGTDLHPTGRVAVFSNSVLFQAGTPLYKQMPGTEYAWHELTVKLSVTADYKTAAATLEKVVQEAYAGYQPRIEAQHRQMESWMDSTVDAPEIESRLQLVDGGLQLFVRFPVEIRTAAQIDQQITQSVLGLMSGDENVKASVVDTPSIKAAIKG
jgi:small-conductance mechanosensitive channel